MKARPLLKYLDRVLAKCENVIGVTAVPRGAIWGFPSKVSYWWERPRASAPLMDPSLKEEPPLVKGKGSQRERQTTHDELFFSGDKVSRLFARNMTRLISTYAVVKRIKIRFWFVYNQYVSRHLHRRTKYSFVMGS